jgi:RNA polymerase sigma-70 factor, ECF subfamily
MTTASNSEDDDSLIDCIISGDTPKFELLVDKYQKKVFGTMFAVLGNRQDAEDITQESFLNAFRKLGQFQRRSSFYTWLYRIAFNLAIDLRRQRARSASRVVSSDLIANASHSHYPAAVEHSPQEIAQTNETVEQVHRALARMDYDRRHIIALRDIDGLDYSEIADMLELPIGTVRSRLHRARLELRELLIAAGAELDLTEQTSSVPLPTVRMTSAKGGIQ